MTIISRLLLLVALAGFACSHVQPVISPVVSVVKDCADQITHQATLNILDDVSAVLICDKGSIDALPGCVSSQLAVVAKQAGWAAVDCAIAEIQKKATDNALASSDPTEDLRARRAASAAAWRANQSP